MLNHRRLKKGQIAPGPNDTESSSGSKTLHIDEMGDRSTSDNNTRKSSTLKLQEVVKTDTEKHVNSIRMLVNVKTNIGKWKAYVCSRRIRKKPVAETEEDREKSRQLNSGLGLDDFREDDIRPGEKKVDRKESELTVASNRALIQYFAKLGQSNKDDETINLEFVQTLLASGASINCTDKYGQTILHEVARAWHADVAKFLIDHGADVNKGDVYGRTPLHIAAAVDYPEMVTLLIENNADREARTIGENQTPVFYAARTDAVQALKTMIVNHNCSYKYEKDYKGRTPIHVAAELDRSETARLLLEMDAPVYLSDNEGCKAITWMVNKMAPVAHEALNQLHLTDRPNRKQYFYLNYLVQDRVKDPTGKVQTPLHSAVQFRQYDLLMHPVFMRALDVMWEKYGRFWALYQLGINLVYIILWTVIGIVVEYDQRHIYNWPEDAWRIVLYLFAAGFTVYQIFDEVMEFRRSQTMHSEYEVKRTSDIDMDLKYCHPRWPEERQYLILEKGELDKLSPKYFKDLWNIFDWICYIMLLVCIFTHVADIIAHTEPLARVHIRLMAITIILLWLRLMKNARAFTLLGPFIVMLGHMLKDCLRFLFLYVEFYIPYLAAFWMIFGGTKRTEEDPNEIVSVDGFTFPGQLFFSLFRLTLVDDYDYDNMKKIDDVMADILLSTWFMLSAILCLNLFIALLSDTFQRVYDNAQANAVMQKAITVVNIWESLKRSHRERFLTYIEEFCKPLKEEYDDDLTQSGEDDIKKITHQIKEELDNLQEMFKLRFGDPHSPFTKNYGFDVHDDGDGDDGNSDDGSTGGGPEAGSVGGRDSRPRGHLSQQLNKFESEVKHFKQSLESVKVQQVELAERLHRDMHSVKCMLKQLLRQDDATEPEIALKPASQSTSAQTAMFKPKRRKKKRPTSAGLEIDTLEDGTSALSKMDSQPLFDIPEFSPALFPDITRSVQPKAFEVILPPASTSQHQSQQPDFEDHSATNC